MNETSTNHEILLRQQTVLARFGEFALKAAERFAEAFDNRLAALARVQDLLTRSAGRKVSLEDLLTLELEVHVTGSRANVSITGPDVFFPPNVSQAMVMVLHELMTNAVKYGALSVDGGRIEVRWSWDLSDGREDLIFQWRERGVVIGNRVPTRGFGSQVIEKSLPYMLGGTADLIFHADGVECTIVFPLDEVDNRTDQDIGPHETTERTASPPGGG